MVRTLQHTSVVVPNKLSKLCLLCFHLRPCVLQNAMDFLQAFLSEQIINRSSILPNHL